MKLKTTFFIPFLHLFWIPIFIFGCGGETKLSLPENPSGLLATAISDSEIDMTWTNNSITEDGFKIERKSGNNGVYSQIGTVGKGIVTYLDSGLDCDTDYYYRVNAYNTAGDSDFSNESFATTLTCPIAIPDAPSNPLSSVVSVNQINISWTDNSDNETGFNIERRIGIGGTYILLGTVNADITNYEDNTVSCETTYYFRISSFNNAGESLYTNVASATTGGCPPTAPSTPSNLQASVLSFSEISLSWSDNSDDEDGFKLERRDSIGTYSQIALIGANQISYQDTNLICDKTYIYRLKAYNSVGDSSYSAEVTAATSVCVAKVDLYGNVIMDKDIFTNEVTLYGEVINTGSLPVCRIKINFDLIAANQSVLASPNQYIYGNTLAQSGIDYRDCLRSGEKGSFKIPTTILYSAIDHYNYSINWISGNIEEPKLILKVKDNINIEQDDYYIATFYGEIENTDTIPACSLKIVFVNKDSFGSLLSVNVGSVNGSTLIINSVYDDACIRPGETRSFSVPTDDLKSFINSYYYNLSWDEKNITESNVSLSVTDISMGGSTYAIFSGHIKNTGTIDAKSVKVNVTTKNFNNKVNGISSGNLSPSTLTPSQFGSFTINASTLSVNINSNYPVINFRE